MNKQTHDFLDYLLNERKYSSKTVDSYKFDLEKFFDVKVYLDLWVKVKEKWRDSLSTLGNFGYREE